MAALRDLCDFRAVEARCAAAAAAATAAHSTSRAAASVRRVPRRLQGAVDAARAAVVRRLEDNVLLPASGWERGSRLAITVLRAVDGSGGETASSSNRRDSDFAGCRDLQAESIERIPPKKQLVSSSVVVGDGGELLYLDHTPAALAAARPASLGRLVRGASTCRTLREAEIRASFHRPAGNSSEHGARRLFGCVFSLFPSNRLQQTQTAGYVSGKGVVDLGPFHPEQTQWLEREIVLGREVALLTPSLEDLSRLRSAAHDWIATSAPPPEEDGSASSDSVSVPESPPGLLVSLNSDGCNECGGGRGNGGSGCSCGGSNVCGNNNIQESGEVSTVSLLPTTNSAIQMLVATAVADGWTVSEKAQPRLSSLGLFLAGPLETAEPDPDPAAPRPLHQLPGHHMPDPPRGQSPCMNKCENAYGCSPCAGCGKCRYCLEQGKGNADALAAARAELSAAMLEAASARRLAEKAEQRVLAALAAVEAATSAPPSALEEQKLDVVWTV